MTRFHNPATGRHAVVEEDKDARRAGDRPFKVVKANGDLAMGVEHFEFGSDARGHARDWVNQRPTNVERIVHIMSYARSGPLMQGFVMNALVEQAKAVNEATIEQLGGERSWINPHAWKACAKELGEFLEDL